jgi:CRP-like cAMP-binding protein
MNVFKLVSTDLINWKSRQFKRRDRLPFRRDYLWQIESGIVRTLTLLEDGTIVTLGLWGTGDIVSGMLSKADPYFIECLTPTEVTSISLTDYPKLDEALILHVRQLQEFLEIISHRPVEASVFKFLTWVAKKFGRQVDRGQLIELNLTHQEIAEILGITRVTVTRSLRKLETGGAIERFDRSSILVQKEQPFWHYEI